MKKLRTLRHPGVIKVLDTVEVGDKKAIQGGRVIDCQTDRNIHLYRDREAGPAEMAHQEKKHECRNLEMGTVWCSCGYSLLDSRPILLTLTPSKQSNLSTTMLPQSTARFEWGRYIPVKVVSGELEALKY